MQAGVFLHLSLSLCWFVIVLAAAQKGDFTVIDPPYNTSVQDLLASALAAAIGPTGGRAYLGTPTTGTVTVCAAAETRALLAPAPVTVVDGLFHGVDGVDAHLDATHACLLNTIQHPPQCIATLTSAAADCGGVAADAVGPLLNASSPLADVATSSAALLASYVRGGAVQRLRLERSLRRTREVVSELSRIHNLVLDAYGTVSDAAEMLLLRRRATQRVREVVSAAYDRVMEKYYVVDAWSNVSLGITAQNLSSLAGPVAGVCEIYSYTRRLLWGTEPSLTVLLELMQTTLALADRIHSKTYTPAARGVQCAQVLTGLAVMALEDDAVRQVAAMIARNTLNDTSAWSISDFALLLPDRTASLRQRQLWNLAYVFSALADPAAAKDLVGSEAVAKCMRRAALVETDASTGGLPPSISWCLGNSSLRTMSPAAVTQRSLAMRESVVAANGQCLWGLSVWDGLCGGAAFNPARCESCPPGSVGDGEGHCVCGNSTGTYPTLTSGCVAKAAAHGVAGVRLLQANGNISLTGNATVALLHVQLPQTASLADPSAYLRVNVWCVDGGRGGGTRLLATPNGDRAASCASVVAYERHAERTGVRNTFNGTQFFETYADNLVISVLGTAAFFGETCRVEVVVQSALHHASRSVVAGTWTFVPQAEPFTLAARSYTGTVPTSALATIPHDMQLCPTSPAVSSDDSGDVGEGDIGDTYVVQVGVCRTADGTSAVYVQPASYSAFGLSVQLAVGHRIRSSAGASRDASFIETMRSLAGRTGFELTVEGATGSDVLWSEVWLLNATPLAVRAWVSGWVVPVEPGMLRNMRSLRLRVVDAAGTTAFVASEATVKCRYGNDADASSSSSDSDNHSGHGTTASAGLQYSFWYVVLIVIVSVLDAAVLMSFGLLVFMRHASYYSWPRWLQ